MRAYDGTFIFSHSFRDEKLQQAVERVGEEIVRLGGEVADRRMMGERTFARPLRRQESGQYVRVHFRMPPDRISSLLARLKLNEDIFRVQIVAASDKAGKAAAEREGASHGGS